MKLPVLLLAGSLAANVALVVVLARKPDLAPPVLRGWLGGSGDAARASGSTHASPRPRPVATKAAGNAGYWASLSTPDLPGLITRLRAAGFPPELIRAVVSAQLEMQFRERVNAIVGAVAETPFWKPEPTSSLYNPKFQEQISQIYRERSRLQRQLLGDEAFMNAGEATAAQRRQYGDLPKAKIDLLQRIVEDYQEMTSQVRSATQGITLPEDREKIALLEREKRADLAAILTPQELEDYEMRNSNTTMRLRQAMTLMDASEEEFRALYKIMQPLTDVINPPTFGVSGADMARLRQEAQVKANEAIKATLGEARFTDYQRANNYEYQQLVRIAQRDNVSTEMIRSTYDLRDELIKESGRIYDDKELNPDEKRAALATLGQKTKAQIIGYLGVNAGNAYIQSATWTTAAERGWVIRVGADGQANSYYSLPTAPPPKN